MSNKLENQVNLVYQVSLIGNAAHARLAAPQLGPAWTAMQVEHLDNLGQGSATQVECLE